MREPQLCNVACRLILDEKAAKEFKEMIDDEYRVNMWGTNDPEVYISCNFVGICLCDKRIFYPCIVAGF